MYYLKQQLLQFDLNETHRKHNVLSNLRPATDASAPKTATCNSQDVL